MKFSELKHNKWWKTICNKYFIILLLFIAWMIYLDTNSFFIHNELNNEIEALEENKKFYQDEIEKDKAFIEKMKDSSEQEKFARERYYLKKEKEDIFLIEHEDSIKQKKKND